MLNHIASRGIAHLQRIEERPPRLRGKPGLAPVMEQPLAVDHVKQRGRVPAYRLPLHAHGGRGLVGGEALVRNVAHGAREGVVERQTAVEKQLAAKFYAFGRRHRSRRERRKAQRHLAGVRRRCPRRQHGRRPKCPIFHSPERHFIPNQAIIPCRFTRGGAALASGYAIASVRISFITAPGLRNAVV